MKTYDDILMEDLLSDNRKRALQILKQLKIKKSLSCDIHISSIANVYRHKKSDKVFYNIGFGVGMRPLTELEDVELELQILSGIFLFKNPRDDFKVSSEELVQEYCEL